MANDKNISIAILGIAAVLAIVGLILMFSIASNSGAFWVSSKVYGGAIKDVAYPNLQDRNVNGISGDQYASQDNMQNMYYERGVRQIPSIQTACGQGLAGVNYQQMLANTQRGADCFEHPAGYYCCTIIGA